MPILIYTALEESAAEACQRCCCCRRRSSSYDCCCIVVIAGCFDVVVCLRFLRKFQVYVFRLVYVKFVE